MNPRANITCPCCLFKDLQGRGCLMLRTCSATKHWHFLTPSCASSFMKCKENRGEATSTFTKAISVRKKIYDCDANQRPADSLQGPPHSKRRFVNDSHLLQTISIHQWLIINERPCHKRIMPSPTIVRSWCHVSKWRGPRLHASVIFQGTWSFHASMCQGVCIFFSN